MTDRCWGLCDVPTLTAAIEGVDARIQSVAAAQHGVISASQHRYLGLSPAAIASRVARGWLRPIHRGVFSVGVPPWSQRTLFAAAILATGPGSALSHWSAAVLWELLRLDPAPVNVTTRRHRRHRSGLVVHRTRHLNRRDVRTIQCLPVTTPERTLLDLAAIAEGRQLAVALNAARLHRRVSQTSLERMLAAASGRPGAAQLRLLLESERDTGFSRSEAEERLSRIIRAAGLPPPQRNVRVHGHELDFYWPRIRLNVEVDGVEWHSTRDRVVSDRSRDAELATYGIQPLRLTWPQLQDELRVAAQLASAIALAEARLGRG